MRHNINSGCKEQSMEEVVKQLWGLFIFLTRQAEELDALPTCRHISDDFCQATRKHKMNGVKRRKLFCMQTQGRVEQDRSIEELTSPHWVGSPGWVR